MQSKDRHPQSSLDAEQAVLFSQSQDVDFDTVDLLIPYYIKQIKCKTARYYGLGLEQDDLIQEGLIGLIDAVRTFDSSKNASFETYANVCIDNRLKKAIAFANTKKYRLLSDSVLLEDEMHTTSQNPEDMVVDKEQVMRIHKQIDTLLSPFEKKTLFLYLDGLSYDKIAQTLGVSPKSVDNALMRTRHKLKFL